MASGERAYTANVTLGRRPPARILRRLAIVCLGLVAAAVATVAWLLRDPVPAMLARRASLAGVDVLDTREAGNYRDEHVRVRSTSGLAVELTVRAPLAAAPDAPRRPLFLILGGRRTGRESAAVLEDTRGTIAVGLEYPYDGPHDLRGFAVIRHVPAIRRAVLDAAPAALLALDYLCARPDVDATRVELVGASFGAPFAVIAAALDPRVTRLWLLHAGAPPYELLEANLEQDVPFAPARAAVAALANLLGSGPRLDPARWVREVAPRPVIMINALEDERIPRHAALTLFAAARDPKELHWLPGMHVQRDRRELLDHLVQTVYDLAARPASGAAGKHQ
jgi:dienelactone hydrolase